MREDGLLRESRRSPRTCNLFHAFSFPLFVPHSPMLLHLFLVLGLFAQLAIAESPATCEEKGFASSLLCSSCDKLSAFVGDSGIGMQHQLLIL